MKPKSYTIKDKLITYHYTFKDLREFLTHGFKEGNNGMLLLGQDERFFYYRGFGTIENPWTHIQSISIENDLLYDGEMPDPKEVLNPPNHNFFTLYRGLIWDVKLSVEGEIYKDE